MRSSSVLTGLVPLRGWDSGFDSAFDKDTSWGSGVQFDKEHPLDWDTLNATRGFCGLGKCYFPSRLSEHEAGQAC